MCASICRGQVERAVVSGGGDEAMQLRQRRPVQPPGGPVLVEREQRHHRVGGHRRGLLGFGRTVEQAQPARLTVASGPRRAWRSLRSGTILLPPRFDFLPTTKIRTGLRRDPYRLDMVRLSRLLVLAVVLPGCASARPVAITEARPASVAYGPLGDSASANVCDNCSSAELGTVLLARSTQRVAELKGRGGECAVYGAVLETSVLGSRISVRPFMWRVGSRLVSGEARPDGEIVVARDIDHLNVGVRTIEDVLWTMEHEAAHLAFRISNGEDAVADRANARVRECR